FHADGIAALETDLAHHRTRILSLQTLAQPLRRGMARAHLEEAIDAVEPRSRHDALPAHVTELRAQEAQEIHVHLVVRREIGVAALGGDYAVVLALGDEERLTQARARRDERHVRSRLRDTRLHRDALLPAPT